MNLEDFGLTKEEIIERLVDRLADDLREQAEKTIDKKVEKIFAQTARDEIVKRIGEVADRYIKTEYQPVNSWGEKVGDPTTIQEVIETSFQTWWTTSVDRNGNPVSKTFYGHKVSRAEYIATQIASEALTDGLKHEYGRVVKQAKVTLAKALTDTIQQQITKLIQ